MVLFMANAIIEKLEALTAGEIRGKQDLFIFLYGIKASEKLNIKSIEDFSFWDNGQSIIIYNGTQAIFDCNYEVVYGVKCLTTCYNKNGLFCEFKNY